MSNYGRINLNGQADSIDRTPKLASERRFDFNARQESQLPSGRICTGCDIRRTAREFAGIDCTYKFCRVCRDRGKSREIVKR